MESNLHFGVFPDIIEFKELNYAFTYDFRNVSALRSCHIPPQRKSENCFILRSRRSERLWLETYKSRQTTLENVAIPKKTKTHMKRNIYMADTDQGLNGEIRIQNTSKFAQDLPKENKLWSAQNSSTTRSIQNDIELPCDV